MGDIEVEEGEACVYMDYDLNIDIDEAFSYIGDRVEDILGHYRKDFEGRLSAETLGARFGGYGSFLPTYQRSPSIWSNSRAQPQVQTHSLQVSSDDDKLMEDATQNLAVSSAGILDVRPKADTSSGPAYRPSSVDSLVTVQSLSKQVSNDEPLKVLPNQPDQKTVKLRIKVGSDAGKLARKTAAIYSNLGLDMSPSASAEDSPTEWERDLPNSLEKDSPSFIVRIMTSSHIPNGMMLSPLHDSLVNLLEEKARPVQESSADWADEEVPEEKQKKPGKKDGRSLELKKESYKDLSNPVSASLKKETNMGTSKGREMLSDALSCPPKSNKKTNIFEQADIGNISEGNVGWEKRVSSKKADRENKLNLKPLTLKVHSEKKLGCDIGDNKSKADEYLGLSKESFNMAEGVGDSRDRKMNIPREKLQNEMKGCHGEGLPSSHGKMKHKGGQDDCSFGAGKSDKSKKTSLYAGPKDKPIHESNFPSKKCGDNKLVKDPSKKKDRHTDLISKRKVGMTESRNHLLKNHFEEEVENVQLKVSEKESSASIDQSKGSSGNKRDGLLSVSEADVGGGLNDVTPLVAPAPVENAPVLIQENWVACDRCQKWRLLPYDTNPEQLPKKWICSMLYWLPGMNRCSFSEDETTNALNALYQVPAIQNHSAQKICDVEMSSAVSLPISQNVHDQNIKYSGSSGGKKKHKTNAAPNPNELSASMKQLNHAMKDKKVSVKSRDAKKMSQSLLGTKLKKSSGDVKPLSVKRNRKSDQDDLKLSKTAKIDCVPYGDQDQSTCGFSKKDNIKINNKNLREMSFVTNEYVAPSLEKLKKLFKKTGTKQEGGKQDMLSKKRKFKNGQDSEIYLDKHPSNEPYLEGDDIAKEETSLCEIMKEKKPKKSKIEVSSSASKTIHKPDGKEKTDKTPFPNSRIDCTGDARFCQENNGKDDEFDQCDIDGKNAATRHSIDERNFMAATSDSSMISDTCKVKVKFQEIKSSSVESVCSSSLRISNQVNPGKSLLGKDSGAIDGLSQLTDQNRYSEGEGFGVNELPEMTGRKKNVFSKGNYTQMLSKYDSLVAGGSESDDMARTSQQFQKTDDQNGLHEVMLRHFSPDQQRTSDVFASNHNRDDYFSWAAKSALKEAKHLDNAADNINIPGSALECTELFFQAALKFLHGASLLNPQKNESANHGEMTSSEMYNSTAKLCESCARNYERCNDMASAALAYKCMEVAYMRMVYFNDFTASRDRNKLQTTLQRVSPVGSPSSSASDVDNSNHEAKLVKMHLAKDVGATQVSGDHVVAARNQPNFVRLLDFAEDVNHAMEASRKCQLAFSAAKTALAETGNMEGISSVKKVLDMGFHDVEGLLQLIRLAKEMLGRSH